jgi:hypothetical protein
MVLSIKESRKLARKQLERLIDEAGSQAQLIRMLNAEGFDITPSGITRWLKLGQISKAGALAVVHHPSFCEKFTLNQLRPDIPDHEWQQ